MVHKFNAADIALHNFMVFIEILPDITFLNGHVTGVADYSVFVVL